MDLDLDPETTGIDSPPSSFFSNFAGKNLKPLS